MNSIIYKQTDSRWAKKAYPSGSTVGGCGCGLLACTHVAMEQESKKNWTPDNLRSYMVNKGFAIRGQGTRWEGITETLKYIGHKSVVRIYNDPMSEAWKELNKGNRIGVILFNNNRGHRFTASGHYIAFTGYKYENKKHYFYLKDSGGRNNSGWIPYEGYCAGCIEKVWIVERVGTETKVSPSTTPKATTADGKLVVDGVGGKATVNRLQEFLGVRKTDGITIKKELKKYVPSLTAYGYGTSGSGTVKYLQKWLGISQDGHWGAGTSKALQKKLGVSQDGIFGKQSMQALQKYLNSNTKAVYPATKPASSSSSSSGSSSSGGKYIGQATKDYDGKAGDSSGKEVTKSAFKYSSSSTSCFNWTYVFRPKDSSKAQKAATMCEKAIANSAIGYNKAGETAYGKSRAMTKLAKAAGYDLGKITTKCGLSCGDLICLCNHWAGLSTCYIGSGLQLANNYKNNSNFTCIKYTKGMALKRGDVLITAHSNGKNNHVAMVL